MNLISYGYFLLGIHSTWRNCVLWAPEYLWPKQINCWFCYLQQPTEPSGWLVMIFFLNERLVMMIDDPGLLFQHFCQLLPCMFIVGGPGSASACRLRTYSLFMDRSHASAWKANPALWISYVATVVWANKYHRQPIGYCKASCSFISTFKRLPMGFQSYKINSSHIPFVQPTTPKRWLDELV